VGPPRHQNRTTALSVYGQDDGEGHTIITRQLSNDILHGITRAAVLRFAKEAQMKVEERLFTIDEAKEADEAFVTSGVDIRDASC